MAGNDVCMVAAFDTVFKFMFPPPTRRDGDEEMKKSKKENLIVFVLEPVLPGATSTRANTWFSPWVPFVHLSRRWNVEEGERNHATPRNTSQQAATWHGPAWRRDRPRGIDNRKINERRETLGAWAPRFVE